MRKSVLGWGLGLLALAARPASACSMCLCGDPTYTLVGSQVFTPGSFRLSFDAERYAKDQALEGGGALREEEVEQRYTLSTAYTVGRRLTLVARLPFSDRTIRSDESRESLRGLADPELLAHWRVVASRRPGSWVSLSAGLRTGWGQNDRQLDGARAEEHLQPGSGARSGLLGAAFARLLGDQASLFGSLSGRWNGRNAAGYRYGNVLLGNLAVERRFSKRFNGVVELNFRDARHDEVEPGLRDPNTGGAVLYVSPRVLVELDARQRLWLRVGVQVPLVEGLHGDQDEKLNVLTGLTVRF